MARRVHSLVFASLATAAVLAGAEAAQANHVPGHPRGATDPAVDQYVERIPTSGGPRASGVAAPRKTQLPRAVARRLQREGGRDAKLLEDIATSEAYGAPVQTLATPRKRDRGKPGTVAAGSEEAAAVANAPPRGALSAVKSVVTDGSDVRLLVLLGLMVAITLAALGAAAYRQRASRGGLRR